MHTKVEYKVKRELGPWEDIPVHVTMIVAGSRLSRQTRQANVIGESLAVGENAIEVRWNFKGSSQGHYVGRRVK